MMYDRGQFINSRRGRQLLRFDGMIPQREDLCSITPTDIDAVIDVRNRMLILFEAKYNGKEVPQGQKKALERLVDDAKSAGKNAIAIVCDHNVEDVNKDVFLKDVFLKDAIAREVYETEHQEWRPMKRNGMTAKELADFYIRTYYRER